MPQTGTAAQRKRFLEPPLSSEAELAAILIALVGLCLILFGMNRFRDTALPLAEEPVVTTVGLRACTITEARDRNTRGPDTFWLVFDCLQEGRQLVYPDDFGDYDRIAKLARGGGISHAVAAKGADRPLPPWLKEGDPILRLESSGTTVRSQADIASSYASRRRLSGLGMMLGGVLISGSMFAAGWHSDRVKRRGQGPAM